ncbi:MAG: hydrogenase formation protein HypD, partial [Chitinivibrionales bacterium]|nr:hydrogenase formation protein HypD [Chitinivibrionales bacterium]
DWPPGPAAPVARDTRARVGPGCPVCVTPGSIIDAAADLAVKQGVSILSFGDMVRVPGNRRSLEGVSTDGADVRVVTSPLQAVRIAIEEPQRRFVFVAVGFETTIPVVARAVEEAGRAGLRNLTFLVTHRLVPPALDALVGDATLRIDGFILPGHVSAIIGERAYARLVAAGVAGVITGFESLDILAGVHESLTLLAEGRVEIVNCYRRVVRPEGNPRALELIERVFEPVDAPWRGIGVIPQSGLALRGAYRAFGACAVYGIDAAADEMPGGCSCGDVLKGVIRPDQCPLFGAACTPASPVGPCMVSSEGSCAAYHKYEVSRQ